MGRFLIQALASLTLLFIIISKPILENLFTLNISPINIIVPIPLLIKTGAAPMQRSQIFTYQCAAMDPRLSSCRFYDFLYLI